MSSKHDIAKLKKNGQVDGADWTWDFLMKTLDSSAPAAACFALNHLFLARKGSNEDKLEAAFFHYKKAMNLLLKADQDQPGVWAEALKETNREYGRSLR